MDQHFVDERFAESDTADAVRRLEAESNLPTPEPTPGRFYRIRSGDTLYGVAGRAFGLGPGSARYTAARRINDSVYNLRFRSAQLADNQFPAGRISFNPRFACDAAAQAAARGPAPRGHCFATIWIPPAYYVAHPLLGTAVTLPAFGPETETSAFHAIDKSCTPNDELARIIDPDTRLPVGDSRYAPFRWVCSVHVFLSVGTSPVLSVVSGSGFLVGRHHVLTVAHVVHSPVQILSTDGVTITRWVLPRIRRIVVIPGKNGIPDKHEPLFGEANPFGQITIPVERVSQKGRRAFRLPGSWTRHVNSELLRLNALSCSLDPATGLPTLPACNFRTDPGHDFALIRLPTYVSIDGYFGHNKSYQGVDGGFVKTSVDEPDDGLPGGRLITATGYPGDKPCELWESNGEVLASTTRRFSHDADIAVGNSGCPIWIATRERDRQGNAGYRYRVVGIQSGTTLPSHPSQTACRISAAWPQILRWFREEPLHRA
jgi:V8-like Glu-specific endopeptidase